MIFNRRRVSIAMGGALALALAACGEQASDPATTTAEPVAAVPAPAGTSWRDTVTVTDSDGYLIGNPDAPIKLIEYASLTCPACAAFAAEGAEPLKEKYVISSSGTRFTGPTIWRWRRWCAAVRTARSIRSPTRYGPTCRRS
jgi:protein-disulfide isomerase